MLDPGVSARCGHGAGKTDEPEGEMSKSNGWLKSKDQINGLLDKGCSFEGKIVFDGTVQINGDFTGEISSDGTLVVGQDARLSGKVFVDTLICYGTIEGKIDAKSRVEIHVPSVVTADVSTKNLSIEEGALFQGHCHMHHPAKVEVLPTPTLVNAESKNLESVAV